MTNADKYLKDGVDVEEFLKAIWGQEYMICDEQTLSWRNCKMSGEQVIDFLNKPLKPTLTEDEKVILNKINTDIYSKIGRHKCGEIIFRNVNDSYVVITPYFRFENMFQFIKPRRRI